MCSTHRGFRRAREDIVDGGEGCWPAIVHLCQRVVDRLRPCITPKKHPSKKRKHPREQEHVRRESNRRLYGIFPELAK